MANQALVMVGLVLALLSMVDMVCSIRYYEDEDHIPIGYKLFPSNNNNNNRKVGGYFLYANKKKKKEVATTLVVEGLVLCQHCNHTTSHPLYQASPLQGAEVQLRCSDWMTGSTKALTNENGYFLITINDFNLESMGVNGCTVSLVSPPPSSPCTTMSDINGGKIGAMIAFRKFNYRQAIYTTGPFTFAPSPQFCTNLNIPIPFSS